MIVLRSELIIFINYFLTCCVYLLSHSLKVATLINIIMATSHQGTQLNSYHRLALYIPLMVYIPHCRVVITQLTPACCNIQSRALLMHHYFW